jgi:glutathione S-transferase
MNIELLFSETSPYSRKVRAMLLEKAVEFIPTDVRTGNRKASDVNPLGKVPTLLVDGEAFYDSRVITGMLEGLFPHPGLLPKDTQERAIVRRTEALCDGLCDVVIPVVIDKNRPQDVQNEALNKRLLAKAKTCLDLLEEAAKEPFLYRGRFSLADIACVSALGYLDLRMPSLLEGYPNLGRYHREQVQRPCLAETLPPDLPML